MMLRHTLHKARTPMVLAAIVVVAGGWLALVGSHDPGGPYGESAAAWAQAIMSVGAILAAVVIDQGASRRDRQDRLEAAAAARAARVRVLQLCAMVLDNAAEAARKRPLKRRQKFEGLALEAVLSARQTARRSRQRQRPRAGLGAQPRRDRDRRWLPVFWMATVWRRAPTSPRSNERPAPAPKPSAKSWMSIRPASTRRDDCRDERRSYEVSNMSAMDATWSAGRGAQAADEPGVCARC
jgi:hypothetical protein